LSSPTGVSASQGTYTDQITLDWNSVTGATGYNVYDSTYYSGTYSLLGSVTSSGTTVTSVSAGTAGYFKVTATANGVESAASSIFSGYTRTDVTTPESFVVRLYVVKDIGEIYSTEEGQPIQINGLKVNYYKYVGYGWWGPGYYISSSQSQGEDLDSKNFIFRLTPSSFPDPILGIKGKYYALDSHGKIAYADFL